MRARTLLLSSAVLLLLGAGAWRFRDSLPLGALEGLFKPAPPPSTQAKARATGRSKAAAKPRSTRLAGASLSGAAGMNPEPPKLTMPAAKACLPPPSGDALPEDGVEGSRGLSAEEVRAAMDAVVQRALPCFADADGGRMVLSVTAGCDGRVSDIRITEDGGFPPDVSGCVVETLRYAAFPAHDMPDGFTFAYPLTYSVE